MVILTIVLLLVPLVVPSRAQSPAPAGDLPPDVPEKHWAAPSVRRTLQLKAVDLVGGKFEGARTATRLDLAQVVAAVLEKHGKKFKPVAVKELPANHPQAKAVGIAIASGAVKARKGRVGVEQPLTRDDLAVAISRMLAIVFNDPEGPVSAPVELNDVPPDSPLYVPIQRAVKAKMISLNANKYEGYNPVTRYLLAAVVVRLADGKPGAKK